MRGPDRRCPKCANALAPDQEWCLTCGAAAASEVVEARAWRVPLYLGGGLFALAIIGVVLAVAAMADREQTADAPAPTPPAAASPEPTVDVSPPEDTTNAGEFTGNDGDYTVIVASKTSESKANRISESAAGKGYTTGVLNSDDYSSLNGGYWVVYSGAYAKQSEAVEALTSIKSDYADAYVMRVEQ